MLLSFDCRVVVHSDVRTALEMFQSQSMELKRQRNKQTTEPHNFTPKTPVFVRWSHSKLWFSGSLLLAVVIGN